VGRDDSGTGVDDGVEDTVESMIGGSAGVGSLSEAGVGG
jgi:hypothetical protein